MVDSSPMCVCPCNPAATRSQSNSLPSYHSTSGEIITSNTLEKSSPLFYILKTTATSTTNHSASLSSSVCHCPCSTTSSASYLLCEYANRNTLAHSRNFSGELKWEKHFQISHPKANVNDELPNPAIHSLNSSQSLCFHLFQHQRISWQILPKVFYLLQVIQ